MRKSAFLYFLLNVSPWKDNPDLNYPCSVNTPCLRECLKSQCAGSISSTQARNGARNVRFQFVHLPLGTSYATRSEWPNIVTAMMIIIHPQAIMINETRKPHWSNSNTQSTKSLPSTLFSRKLFLILTEKLQPFQDTFDNHKKIELHILKTRWTICNLRHTYVKKVFQLSHYNPLLGPSPLIYMSDIYEWQIKRSWEFTHLLYFRIE